MRLTLPRILAVVVVVLLVVGSVVLITAPGRYTATAFLPAGNPNIIEGAPVLVNGFDKGNVESLEPVNDGAEVTVALDSDVAPLHAGAVVFVQWSATVGERLIQINDGPQTNPEIPNGGRIEGNMPEPMEISDILRGLDEESRAKLGPLAQQLRTAVTGSEQDLNETLRAAGPAFTAVGNLTRGLAIDGEALNALVNDTNALVGRIAVRQDDLSGIVGDLTTSTGETVAVREQLRETLQKLPPTLRQADATLQKVPGTAAETIPLLNDLELATDRLPSVANNLAPLLQDLRPTIAELNPTLEALDRLLDRTPALLDSAEVTIPKASESFEKLTPALKDVAPFTPCVVSFLSGAGATSAYADANGQFVRVPLRFGPTSINELPVGLPPGSGADPVSRLCESRRLPAGPGGALSGIPLPLPGVPGSGLPLPGAPAPVDPAALPLPTGGLN